jgi:hypothetical protein
MPGADETPGLASGSDLVIPMIFRLDDGVELRLFSTTTKFGSALDITLDELAIELYHPADDASAAYFTRAQ